ncbi:MAG: MoaD/ThiS family protein [Pyrinomonadaceae bacterium]
MALTILLSGHLKSFTAGVTEVRLDGEFAAVGEALESLWRLHPALRDRVLDEQGEIRKHVNVFVGSRDVKRLDGLATRLNADEIHIFNAVSGG